MGNTSFRLYIYAFSPLLNHEQGGQAYKPTTCRFTCTLTVKSNLQPNLFHFAGVLGGEGSRLCFVGAASLDSDCLKYAEVCIKSFGYIKLAEVMVTFVAMR